MSGPKQRTDAAIAEPIAPGLKSFVLPGAGILSRPLQDCLERLAKAG